MPQARTTTSWWTEVEHLREPLERRRREAESSRPELHTAAPAERPRGPRVTPRPEAFQRHVGGLEAAASATATLVPERVETDTRPDGARSADHAQAPTVHEGRAIRQGRRRHEEALVQAAHPRSRRTVQIRGQAIPMIAAPRLVEVDRRRPPRWGTPEKVKRSPDYVALWAFVLGLLLVSVAILTAHSG
jgi:hypothetical protein